MISSDCDFEKFVRAIKGKNTYDIIYLAEKEAMLAWRQSYNGQLKNDDKDSNRQYQAKLIGLIDFMRHGLKPSSLNDQDLRLCSRLQETPVRLPPPGSTNGYLNLVK